MTGGVEGPVERFLPGAGEELFGGEGDARGGLRNAFHAVEEDGIFGLEVDVEGAVGHFW